MKKLRIMISGVVAGVILIVTMSVSMFACSPSRMAAMSAADAQASETVTHMLDNRLYKVDFTQATPMAAPTIFLGGGYYVSVIGSRVESFLPYYGRVYSIPLGGGEGLRFDAPITDYRSSTGRRGQHEISFTARTAEDEYTFDFEIQPAGGTYLTVGSVQRQTISFIGEMDLDPDFEKVRVE